VDDDDPVTLAVADVGVLGQLAVEVDLARVGPRGVHPGQDLHEGGLPRAVLTAEVESGRVVYDDDGERVLLR
jgi:hypothetical protein